VGIAYDVGSACCVQSAGLRLASLFACTWRDRDALSFELRVLHCRELQENEVKYNIKKGKVVNREEIYKKEEKKHARRRWTGVHMSRVAGAGACTRKIGPAWMWQGSRNTRKRRHARSVDTQKFIKSFIYGGESSGTSTAAEEQAKWHAFS